MITAKGTLLTHRHSYHNIRDRRNTVVGNGNPFHQQTSASSISGHTKSPFRSSKSSSKTHVQLTVSGPLDDASTGSPRSKKGSTLPKEFRIDPPLPLPVPHHNHNHSHGHGHGKRMQSESEEKSRKANKSLALWRTRGHRKAHSLGGK